MYRLGRYLDPVTLTCILRSSDFDIFCVDVRYRLNYKAYNHQTLQSASPQCTDLADTLTWWPWPIFWLQWLWHNLHQRSRSPSVRPLATKPCIMLLLYVLTWQVSWSGDLDLYFALQCLLYILDNVQYLLSYKAYNHQTLHSASPQCTDSAGTLTGWPWPIFHAPLTFTPFMSPFHMSSTVRPSTTKPYIALLLDVLTRQVPWPGDLHLYCALQWLWHILYWCSVSPQI